MVLCESLLVAVLGGSCLIVGSTPPRPSGTPESSRAGKREYEIEREHWVLWTWLWYYPLTELALGVPPTKGHLVLGQLLPQPLVLLLQRVHGWPRPSWCTAIDITVKCIIAEFPHHKQYNPHHCGRECVCVCVWTVEAVATCRGSTCRTRVWLLCVYIIVRSIAATVMVEIAVSSAVCCSAFIPHWWRILSY